MNLTNYKPVLSDEAYQEGTADPMINPSDWRAMITAPMEANCLAPSDEALGAAFDLYCDALAAPFRLNDAAMAELYAEVVGGIADLQIIAPDLLEGILSPTQKERV
ncbi:MAG: hypothetical protein ABJO27_09940 [Pseudoruegeria sp.]